MFEQWKNIKGFEKYYQVSNLGRVKSLPRTGKYSMPNEKILSLIPQKTGYLQVTLSIEGKKYPFNVHRLVALNFIDNPKNKPQVNHIDGDKKNNNVSNLEWVTHVENSRHCWDNKLQTPLVNMSNPQCKLSEEDVKNIRYLRNVLKEKTTKIAQMYNVTKGTISCITNYKQRIYV